MSIPRIIRQRRSNTEAWVGADPVLDDGERAWDIVTKRTKIGDGIRRWSELPEFAADDPVLAPELPNATMHLIAREEAVKPFENFNTDLVALYILAKS